MNRVISYGLEARKEMAEGADFLADCVETTLGLYGQTWFLDKKNANTNDGIAVANEVQLSSATIMPSGKPATEINNRGASAIREAGSKTAEEVEDASTTSIMLARAIYHEAARNLSDEGIVGKLAPSEVAEKIEAERALITAKLTEMSTPIESEEQMINSANVSMGNKTYGALIGSAQWKLGKDGVIIPEESNDKAPSIEFVKGVRLDNGVGSGTLINNHEKQTMEVAKTGIVLTSYTIKTQDQFDKWIVPIAEKVQKMGGDQLVVVARAWTDEALQLCLLNINKGAVKIYPMNSPYVNMNQRMKDLSAVTGATYFDCESTRLEDLQDSDIGFAEKIISKRMEAIITGAEDKESALRVASRVADLTLELGGTESDFERKELSKRIAQMTNGFAILKVTAESNMERKRLYDKAYDAVHAVRWAIQEGTVKGGGLAFKEISESLPKDSILKRPLLVIYQRIMESAPKGFVIQDWVRDPLKVLRVALKNSCDTANSFANIGGVSTAQVAKPLDAIFRKEVANAEQN